MTGRMLAFEFREGGAYRLRLTYNDPHHATGKTSSDADDVDVRFVRLVQGRCIEQAVTFESDDPRVRRSNADCLGVRARRRRNAGHGAL